MMASDKPRERLKIYGADNLTNRELLAIIINTGSRNESSLSLADNVLKNLKKINDLRDIKYQELTKIKMNEEVKTRKIFEIIESNVRSHIISLENYLFIHSPDDISNFLMKKMRYYQQEHFVVLYLSTKYKVIHQETVFKGSLNTTVVHPREIFKEAVKRSAAAFICVHNHPSGDPTPSSEDIEVSKRLKMSSELIGIDFLDHI